MLTDKTVHIGSRAPVRRAVANLPNYFPGHSDAFDAIDTILKGFKLRIDPNMMIDLSSQNDRVDGEGSSGTVILNISPLDDNTVCDACNIKVKNANYANGISYSWYRMSSGKLEIVAYVSL